MAFDSFLPFGAVVFSHGRPMSGAVSLKPRGDGLFEKTQQTSGHEDKQWQMVFLAYQPTIQKYLALAFWHMAKDQREKAIQEAMACVYAALERLAAQDWLNRAYPTVLARFAVLHVFVGGTIGSRPFLWPGQSLTGPDFSGDR